MPTLYFKGTLLSRETPALDKRVPEVPSSSVVFPGYKPLSWNKAFLGGSASKVAA